MNYLDIKSNARPLTPALARTPVIVVDKITSDKIAKKSDRKLICENYGKELKVLQLTYDENELSAAVVSVSGREIPLYLLSPGINYTLKFSRYRDTNPPCPIAEFFNMTR